jgi:glycosyltransferase involved in cell wall biosynthesis
LKKVLVIAYYWPPSAGSGVQRWLKFVKYLREFGWEPIVYTPENPDFDLQDKRLCEEIPEGIQVIKQPIFEPFQIYSRLTGQKAGAQVNPVMKGGSKESNWKTRLALWIRANVFIPDSRMFWIRPSVSFLSKWLAENPVDAIVSTGPPHSMHLIGLGLKEKTGLPWLADFRDPWTRIDFYHELPLEPWADEKHRRLERKVLRKADSVLVVGNQMKADLVNDGFRHVHVVTNGYDPADIDLTQPVERDKKFSILHIGMLGKARSHAIFWQGLEQLRKEIPGLKEDLEVKIYGVADPWVMAQTDGFEDKSWIHFLPYIPHEEVIRVQRAAAVLLLSINDVPSAKGIITGKIFEYLAIGNPILCIGPPDGDAAAIVEEAKAGPVVGFEDSEGFKQAIISLYENWKAENQNPAGSAHAKYSRRELCGKVAEILNEISDKSPDFKS